MIIDIYLRISKARKHDVRYASLESQEATCRRRVAAVGVLGMVHRDRGLSAWRAGVVRPGWDALMARLESGAAAGVCVFDLERFSRKPIDGERLISCAERGRIVLDADSAMDLSTPSGKKNFRDAMNAAAYYSDRLSQRLTREGNGKEQRAVSGIPNASHRLFGFAADGVTLLPAEADALRAIAQLFLRGGTLDALIAELSARGLAPVAGGTWTRSGVRRLLLNPRLAGRVVYRGTVVGALPVRVLPEDVYAMVVGRFAARSAGRPASYLLSGIARCGLCGGGLTGQRRADLVDADLRSQYVCAAPAGCRRVCAAAGWLDDMVLDLAIDELIDPDFRENVAARSWAAERRHGELAAALAGIDETLIAVAGRVGRQEMLLAEADAITGPLRVRRSQVVDAMQEVTDRDASDAASAAVPGLSGAFRSRLEWLDTAVNGSAAERRSMVVRALAGRTLMIGPGRPSVPDASRVSFCSPK